MKVLNPTRPKFPIKVETKEDYIKKSEWLFNLGYSSYGNTPIHEAVTWWNRIYYIKISTNGGNNKLVITYN